MGVQKTTHFGRAAEYYAMSELLLRGWNVAVPVVDVGDDVFVIDDRDKTTFRVQAKSTAVSRDGDSPIVARFKLQRAQLKEPGAIDLFYILLVRVDETWRFLVIPREKLAELHADYLAGYAAQEKKGRGRPPKADEDSKSGELVVEVTLAAGDAVVWGYSVAEFLDAWPSELPLIEGGPGARA